MTTVEIDTYDDLRDDQAISSRRRDLILDHLQSGTAAVGRLEDWLVDEKDLESIESVDDLFAGRVVAESEKAYLFTTTDEEDPDADQPGTDWVPKSQTRIYVAGNKPDESERGGHRSLQEFAQGGGDDGD